MKADVIVIGGGIIGVSAAWQLAERGLQVALFERGALAGGSTGRGAGVVDVQRWNATDALLVARSKRLFADAAAASHGVSAVERCGALNLAASEQATPLQRQTTRLREAGHDVEWLDKPDLRRRFPWLNVAQLVGGAFSADDGFVRPGAFVSVAAALARGRGAHLYEGAAAERVLVKEDRVTGVRVGEIDITASTVVLAAGAWTRPLLRSAGVDVPMLPYRTQVCFVHVDVLRAPVLHDLTQGIYTVPREAGQLLVGDGTEHWASDPEAWRAEPDASFLASAAERLRRRVRGVVREATGGWAGLCQATPDRYPFLGPFGGLRGLHVACGFNGFGVMRGPAVGELLAELIASGAPPAALGLPPDLGPYRADRFPEVADFPIREGYAW